MNMRTTSKNILCYLAAFLLMGSASIAKSDPIYKCVNGAGKTAYQSEPCPASTRSSEVAIQGASSIPNLTANTTVADAKQAILSSCINNGEKQANSAFRKIATEQPRKFESFCECVADTSLSDVNKVRSLIASKDRAGLEQLGMKAGLSCAPKLQ